MSEKWLNTFWDPVLSNPCGSVVKNPPAMQEMWVQSLDQQDPLEEEMAAHSSILTWEIHGQRRLAGYSPWCHRVLSKWTLCWLQEKRGGLESKACSALPPRPHVHVVASLQALPCCRCAAVSGLSQDQVDLLSLSPAVRRLRSPLLFPTLAAVLGSLWSCTRPPISEWKFFIYADSAQPATVMGSSWLILIKDAALRERNAENHRQSQCSDRTEPSVHHK